MVIPKAFAGVPLQNPVEVLHMDVERPHLQYSPSCSVTDYLQLVAELLCVIEFRMITWNKLARGPSSLGISWGTCWPVPTSSCQLSSEWESGPTRPEDPEVLHVAAALPCGHRNSGPGPSSWRAS